MALRAVRVYNHGESQIVDTTGAFIRSPWIMTGAWDTSTTSAHRLTSSNTLQNNLHKTHATCGHRNHQKGWPAQTSKQSAPRSRSPWRPDQALAPRPELKERVRPGESALAILAMTCSGGGGLSSEPGDRGEPTGAGA